MYWRGIVCLVYDYLLILYHMQMFKEKANMLIQYSSQELEATDIRKILFYIITYSRLSFCNSTSTVEIYFSLIICLWFKQFMFILLQKCKKFENYI